MDHATPEGPTAMQGRVLACLIEKDRTTPDSYPLSTNALRAAANQTTNRDPVVDYTERDIDATMLELREMGLARTVTGAGHRVGKHKHIVDEALGLDGHELAVLAVLVLRGPQTRNEIVARTERYTDGPCGDPAAVDAAIDRLASRSEPLVARRDRRPGEREPRIEQVWVSPHEATRSAPPAPTPPRPTPGEDATAPVRASTAAPGAPAAPTPSDLETRVGALEAELAEQRRRLETLLLRLGEEL